MPFQSKAQMRGAFGGYLGPEMQSKADEWAHETPKKKQLPEHKGNSAITGLRKAKPKGNTPDGDR